MSGKKHWKTIYKELEAPIVLYSDDWHSICVLANCSKKQAFSKLKRGLAEYYGRGTNEYKKLTKENQLRAAFLRRPRWEDDEDMDAIFVAEAMRGEPREHDVWIYDVQL